MERLLEEIAERCLRNANRAVERLTHPLDERDAVVALADLAFAGAIARVTVINLHFRQSCGQIDDMATARISLTLGQTLRLVASHTSGVMDGSRAPTYNRPIAVGIHRETDHLRPCVTRSSETCLAGALGPPVGDRRVS